MKRNIIGLFFLLFLIENIFSEGKETQDVIGAIYYMLEKNTYVIVDISKHNIYVQEPYFIEKNDPNGILKEIIGIILHEYLLQLIFSDDENLLQYFLDPSLNVKIFSLRNEDGIRGLLELIIKYSRESGVNPDKIKLRP
jgi:hypothetical protein